MISCSLTLVKRPERYQMLFADSMHIWRLISALYMTDNVQCYGGFSLVYLQPFARKFAFQQRRGARAASSSRQTQELKMIWTTLTPGMAPCLFWD